MMNSNQFLAETEAEAKPIVRATVLRILADGTVSCACTEDSSRIRADVLHGSGPPLLLVPSDKVLVWLSSPDRKCGVILGRIGPSQATLSDSQKLSDEIVLEAKRTLTFKCGKGSITLRADGKILIKGKDLVSHAQRANRIKGGSVAIN